MKNILNYENETSFSNYYKKFLKLALDELAIYFKDKKGLSVDLIIVDNENIKEISNQYRHKNYETDVLSFPSNLELLKKELSPYPLGEIFISYEKIAQQAKNFNHSVKREIVYLFTHGLVHLKGFDHQTEKEEKEMNSIVDHIMNKLNILRK